MEWQRVDIVAKPHTRGALQGGGDHQVGAGQDRIVSEVVLGEPVLPEPKRFCQSDLIEYLAIGLIMRHTPPLTVVEQSKVHAYLLSKSQTQHQCQVRYLCCGKGEGRL
jgi:hypothetical protein